MKRIIEVSELITLVVTFLVVALFIAAGLRFNRTDWGALRVNVIDGWLRLYCRVVHRFRFDPIPLPDSGPALVVANHISGLDPFLMIAAAERPLRFIIAREQYERWGMKWLFRAVGCIPVDRSRHPQQAFREALDRLREGEVIALFPGGHIHIPGEPEPRLKRGVARLAELSDAAVYPVRISGPRGQGHVMRSVFLPSRSRLQAFGRYDCHSAGEKPCLEYLSALFSGRETAPAPPQSDSG